jgi:hypothetical protein
MRVKDATPCSVRRRTSSAVSAARNDAEIEPAGKEFDTATRVVEDKQHPIGTGGEGGAYREKL